MAYPAPRTPHPVSHVPYPESRPPHPPQSTYTNSFEFNNTWQKSISAAVRGSAGSFGSEPALCNVNSLPDESASQLELARQSLESKDYQQAVALTQAILEREPGHAEATVILDEAGGMITQLETAVAEAQALLAAGQGEHAARSLAVALAIDPNQPVAVALSNQLNSHFRKQAGTGCHARGARAGGGRRA